ncbi:MAG: hypothetical protein GY705_17895, partial [Bacteroidetes bacterium]|nr:hypothetical protein [Bacteroidota bacterium]
EFQSNGKLTTATSIKEDNSSRYNADFRNVNGPITTLSATTHGVIYEDNMTRVFQLAIDESKEQTERVLNYQDQLYGGRIDKQRQKKIKHFIQNMVRILKPCEVVNPYADKISLPKEMKHLRRYNPQLKLLINQITILHQYQRKRDKKGRLITEIEDVKAAIEIMFDAIVLKVDELDGSLRQFYEQLKAYILKQGKNYEFGQREIRQLFRLSKSRCFRFIKELEELEYLEKVHIGKQNTNYYKITYWDSLEALRFKIRKELTDQLNSL